MYFHVVAPSVKYTINRIAYFVWEFKQKNRHREKQRKIRWIYGKRNSLQNFPGYYKMQK